jgi:hypothetical protein
MKGQDYIDKSRQYLDYLEEHLKNVQFAFTEVSDACDGMQWVGDDYAWHTLRSEVIAHDLSKFSKEEFVQYRASFFPVNDEDKKASGFDSAWENHKEKNHHHHETAQNYHDLVHMVIDWTAMGYKFGDTAKSYYEANKSKMNLSAVHEAFVYEIFDRIENHRAGV